MEALDKLIESGPKIIKEAAKSRRGFSCLIVLALSVVGVVLFKDASEIGRIVAYISLIGSFVFFGILVFRQSPGAPVSQAAATRKCRSRGWSPLLAINGLIVASRLQ